MLWQWIPQFWFRPHRLPHEESSSYSGMLARNADPAGELGESDGKIEGTSGAGNGGNTRKPSPLSGIPHGKAISLKVTLQR